MVRRDQILLETGISSKTAVRLLKRFAPIA
jgi:hypothetical protein